MLFSWQGLDGKARRRRIPFMGLRLRTQRRQPAVAAKTLRAAGLLLLGFVVAGVTARCGDAPPAPPRPKPKSPAAAPLPILRQNRPPPMGCFAPVNLVAWRGPLIRQCDRLSFGVIKPVRQNGSRSRRSFAWRRRQVLRSRLVVLFSPKAIWAGWPGIPEP